MPHKKSQNVKFIIDLMLLNCSLEHSFGHIYAMVAAYNKGYFDEDICYLSGFMLLEFSCGQGLIITVTALSGKSPSPSSENIE